MKNESEKITKEKPVRVRFAPSPTGYLHIGSARTAFFNWLFARKNNGVFVLRIEDTDIERHMEETIELIKSSLNWMGINWDEGPDAGGDHGPYRQSERKQIYKEYAERLVNQKKAYRCFCSPEKLAEKRSLKSGSADSFKYDRECLNLSEDEISQKIKEGIPYAIRILVPVDIDVSFTDSVYGKISVNSSTIEDYIILRSNGLPIYNFSAAVDDILMQITHIIRGEDHLSNTPKQILVYRAFGKNLPFFTHLPMILGSDGKKLSKRHGSISIESYVEDGFLPEAILNYLALLGWAYDEKTTVFGEKELIEKFRLDNINKKPARFDYDKLIWLNKYYIRNSNDKEIESLVYDRLKNCNIDEKTLREILPKRMPLVKERIKTIKEAGEWLGPFFNEILYNDELKNYFADNKETVLQVIDLTIKKLNGIDRFSKQNIEQSLRDLTDELGMNLRKIAEIIRIAIWGSKVSPPIFGTIEIIGRETAIKRLSDYKAVIT
jgi:glutamyl-tRNA synthetase